MCTNGIPAECAACGKGGDGLKTCTACKMAKYCGVACQQAHRPSHKKACKQRARELLNEALFKPPQKVDCPICFLPLPLDACDTQYQACCGKTVCKGCVWAVHKESLMTSCPFCRTPDARNYEEVIKRCKKRTKFADPDAFQQLGNRYMNATDGLPLDFKKGFQLVMKAAELGLVDAHNSIALCYQRGEGVGVDMEKAKQHYEKAVMGGNVVAMYNLGVFAYNDGNLARAKKHWIVAASAGYGPALVKIREGFFKGYITKDEFERALRDHKDSADEMKSDQRDCARANAHHYR